MSNHNILLMKTTIFVVVLLTVCFANDFDDYCVKFNKHYTPVEKLRREALFNAQVAFINAANAQGNNYTLGLNQFSDMTPDEIRSKVSLMQSLLV